MFGVAFLFAFPPPDLCSSSAPSRECMRGWTVPDELRTWWQNTTPEVQSALQTGGLVLAALLAPRGPAPAEGAASGTTPTLLAGLLVRLTVWAGAGWWLARQYGRVELANTLGQVISRSWALAAGLVAALAVGGLVARRLV